jgi:hypothetical protein
MAVTLEKIKGLHAPTGNLGLNVDSFGEVGFIITLLAFSLPHMYPLTSNKRVLTFTPENTLV